MPEWDKWSMALKKDNELNIELHKRWKESGESRTKFIESLIKGKLKVQPIVKREEERTRGVPPCPYVAEISDTEIECGKDISKGKKPIKISKASCWKHWERKEFIRRKMEKKEGIVKDQQKSIIKFPPREKTSELEIADQLGVCLNPILTRQTHVIACAICKKRHPEKRQACDEILRELKISQIAYDKFLKAMIAKIRPARDWWQVPKTEDMTLEKIEDELGLNPIILG